MNGARAMLGLSKKTYRAIAEYPDTWGVARGTRGGRPMFVRFRSGLKEAVGHTSYPFQIGVAVQLAEPTRDGLTTADEAARLASLEDALDSAFSGNGDAVFAVAVTAAGVRELVFYAREWKPKYFEDKVAKTGAATGYQPQFIMRADRDWETYCAFTG